MFLYLSVILFTRGAVCAGGYMHAWDGACMAKGDIPGKGGACVAKGGTHGKGEHLW